MNSGQNRICDLNRDGYGSAFREPQNEDLNNELSKQEVIFMGGTLGENKTFWEWLAELLGWK